MSITAVPSSMKYAEKISDTFKVVGDNFVVNVKQFINKENHSMFSKLKYLLALTLVAMSIPTSNAFALGQCGGVAKNSTQLISNWESQGVKSQAANVAKSAGYSRADSSLEAWMKERVIFTKLYKTTTIANFGCGGGKLGSVGPKTLTKGWPVAVALPDNLSKKDVRTKKPHKAPKGFKWKRKVIRAVFVAQGSCSNPGKKHVVYVVVWVLVKKNGSGKPNKPCDCFTQPAPSNVTIVCGNYANDSQNVNQGDNCNQSNTSYQTYQWCVNQQGWTWNSETNVCSPPQSPPPPPEKSIKITAKPDINDIPAGKSSGQLYVVVDASDAGGTLTIDPGIGSIATCDNPNARVVSLTFSNLGSGSSSACYVLWAPDDPAKPSTMTVDYTATLGSASDTASNTFAITYPTRT